LVIETPNWNKDKFGEPVETGTDYFKKRETTKFTPIVGETLGGYCRRMQSAIYEQEKINITAHTGGRKVWFTHRTPSECWICNDINAMWFLFETMNMMPNKEKLVFQDDKGMLKLVQVD
jgi:hypothetical protein